MNREDLQALVAVRRRAKELATAVRLVTASFAAGGRLIYAGAGTSGRLGVLDAAECPPTFSTDPAMVVGVIAGGATALKRSVEQVEDDPAAGAAAIRALAVKPSDVVIGIAAGGTTPFVHGALAEARRRQAKTIFLTCTDRRQVRAAVDLFIGLLTGPEIIAGSTRLKAATATKLALNTISTLAMVQMGKVYGNLMVDLDVTRNRKLTDRGLRIIMELTALKRRQAARLLARAGGKVKRAVVMHRHHCTAAEADRRLEQAAGKLRVLIG